MAQIPIHTSRAYTLWSTTLVSDPDGITTAANTIVGTPTSVMPGGPAILTFSAIYDINNTTSFTLGVGGGLINAEGVPLPNSGYTAITETSGLTLPALYTLNPIWTIAVATSPLKSALITSASTTRTADYNFWCSAYYESVPSTVQFIRPVMTLVGGGASATGTLAVSATLYVLNNG